MSHRLNHNNVIVSHGKELSLYGNDLVRPERERMLHPYDTRISEIGEYIYVAVQFGYMGLFASALPIAPLFVLMSNFIEVSQDRLYQTLYSLNTVMTRQLYYFHSSRLCFEVLVFPSSCTILPYEGFMPVRERVICEGHSMCP